MQFCAKFACAKQQQKMQQDDNNAQQQQQFSQHPQPELVAMYGKKREFKHRNPNNPRNDKDYQNPIFRFLYTKPLETDDDVQKYIDERKKSFPTKHIVAKKHKEIEERKKRGEIIVTAHDRVRPLLQIMGIDNGPAQGRNYRENQQQSNSRSYQQQQQPRQHYNEHSKPKYEKKVETEQAKPQQEATTSKQQQDAKPEASPAKPKQQPREKKDNRISKPSPSHSKRPTSSSHQQQQYQAQQPAFMKRKNPSLLQHLLLNEIRREKSILLQSLRYMVNEKFFCNPSASVMQRWDQLKLKREEQVVVEQLTSDLEAHAPEEQELVKQLEAMPDDQSQRHQSSNHGEYDSNDDEQQHMDDAMDDDDNVDA